jgi:hypothetical protein
MHTRTGQLSVEPHDVGEVKISNRHVQIDDSNMHDGGQNLPGDEQGAGAGARIAMAGRWGFVDHSVYYRNENMNVSGGQIPRLPGI